MAEPSLDASLINNHRTPNSYFSWKEIAENSPSRRDGISLRKEISVRRTYFTFLNKLAKQLHIHQLILSGAIVFCHRFFIRQSLAKNDFKFIATACMFISLKSNESFASLLKEFSLERIVLASHELMHPDAVTSKVPKAKFRKHEDLILQAEMLILVTLNFNFSVDLPYQPLIQMLRKFEVKDKVFINCALCFTNDGLRTWLCLQYDPQPIAAAAIFLTGKFYKKMSFQMDDSWFQELGITSQQLKDITDQMLLEYKYVQPKATIAGTGDGLDQPIDSSSTAGNLNLASDQPQLVIHPGQGSTGGSDPSQAVAHAEQGSTTGDHITKESIGPESDRPITSSTASDHPAAGTTAGKKLMLTNDLSQTGSQAEQGTSGDNTNKGSSCSSKEVDHPTSSSNSSDFSW